LGYSGDQSFEGTGDSIQVAFDFADKRCDGNGAVGDRPDPEGDFAKLVVDMGQDPNDLDQVPGQRKDDHRGDRQGNDGSSGHSS
jgi:hypothetical protein